jgi:hypothetical protein
MLVLCTNRQGRALYININHVVNICEVPVYPGSEETHYVVTYSDGSRDCISDADASKLIGKMHL